MNAKRFSLLISKGIYRLFSLTVHTCACLALFLIILFIYLRLFGVPSFLLEKGLEKAHSLGISVSVDKVILTLRGWRAENVCYLSHHPDDKEPLFQVNELHFSFRPIDFSKTLNLTVRADNFLLNSSKELALEWPDESPSRRVGRMDIRLQFLPNRIVLKQGDFLWRGIQVKSHGTYIKGSKDTPEREKGKSVVPARDSLLSREQVQAFDHYFKKMELLNGATVEFDFLVDGQNTTNSLGRLDVSAKVLKVEDVEFSKLQMGVAVDYPSISIERLELFLGENAIRFHGNYDLVSGIFDGKLENKITSATPLTLLPNFVHDFMRKQEVRFDALPELELSFGPSAIYDLPNHLTGTFSLTDCTYKGLEIPTVSGHVERKNGRLEINEIKGIIKDAPHLQDEYNSSMCGGTVEGSVFWDENTWEFGVQADAVGDPNRVVKALEHVPVANNVIQRFSIHEEAPHIQLSLGADVRDWSTFYINVTGVGDNIEFEGIPLSKVKVSAAYTNLVLRLDPLWGMQDEKVTDGWAEVDFGNHTVTVDATSTMNPADVEDMAYGKFNLFGNHIHASGAINMTAKGIIDWDDMQQTDFVCQMEADQLETPAAVAKQLKCEVTGKGPLVCVRDASFNLYGGACTANLFFMMDPADPEFPYEIDLVMNGIQFDEWLNFIMKRNDENISGKLYGTATVKSDFSGKFLSNLNGKAKLTIKDGQLADLPLFEGFSKLMRNVIPGFNIFSFTRMDGEFIAKNGTISSDEVSIEGNIISVRGRGSYKQQSGFDAWLQVHMLRETTLSKVVRVVTDPFMKLFDIRLKGPLEDPTWRLDKFSPNFKVKEK